MVVDAREITLGNGEIRVAGKGSVVYAAPTLICHYIGGHAYQPPAQFLESADLL